MDWSGDLASAGKRKQYVMVRKRRRLGGHPEEWECNGMEPEGEKWRKEGKEWTQDVGNRHHSKRGQTGQHLSGRAFINNTSRAQGSGKVWRGLLNGLYVSLCVCDVHLQMCVIVHAAGQNRVGVPVWNMIHWNFGLLQKLCSWRCTRYVL